MVEVRIEEMFGSDRSRPKDYERAVVVDAEAEESGKTTLGSERRTALKNCLTGPTLLEMSGKRINRPNKLLGTLVVRWTTCRF